MQGSLRKRTRLWSILAIASLLTGCAPGPPPPPIFPGLFGFGLGWLITGILIWTGFLFLKNRPKEKPKTDHLTEAMNAINQRLKVLEEKIEQMENNNHRKTE